MSYLYAIQMLIPDYVHPVKIGLAVKPARRVGSYSGEPFPVLCLGTWRGTREDEQSAHARFAEHRMCGEWFYPVDDLLLFIQSKTGLVKIYRKAGDIDSRRMRRMLGDMIHAEHEPQIREVLTKAHEVMARFRTHYLTDEQVRALLGVSPQVLRNLREDGTLVYETTERYGLEDIASLLKREPHMLRHIPGDWLEVDRLIYAHGDRRAVTRNSRTVYRQNRASRRIGGRLSMRIAR